MSAYFMKNRGGETIGFRQYRARVVTPTLPKCSVLYQIRIDEYRQTPAANPKDNLKGHGICPCSINAQYSWVKWI